ncbi:MAG: hypothetical protein ACI8Z1_003617, partial [Candidatus Azotimanducaceae bacterium]
MSIEDSIDQAKEQMSDTLETSSGISNTLRFLGATVVLLFVLVGLLGYYWDTEPEMFDVTEVTSAEVAFGSTGTVTGTTTVATMIKMSEVLLYKRGGYLHNDIMPPSVFMDNIPNWEFGVLVQIRDMARTLRNNLSRSQSQSTEDADLVAAEGQF